MKVTKGAKSYPRVRGRRIGIGPTQRHVIPAQSLTPAKVGAGRQGEAEPLGSKSPLPVVREGQGEADESNAEPQRLPGDKYGAGRADDSPDYGNRMNSINRCDYDS